MCLLLKALVWTVDVCNINLWNGCLMEHHTTSPFSISIFIGIHENNKSVSFNWLMAKMGFHPCWRPCNTSGFTVKGGVIRQVKICVEVQKVNNTEKQNRMASGMLQPPTIIKPMPEFNFVVVWLKITMTKYSIITQKQQLSLK